MSQTNKPKKERDNAALRYITARGFTPAEVRRRQRTKDAAIFRSNRRKQRAAAEQMVAPFRRD